ncbi:hypothetical protein [Thalassovita aquimarina]|uniref:Uncharacterized protein n=1 Tax=Thalassovita aquimarina TaxID=2785917 RepID=A0ABS5HSQ0_9RHOB|nr:hypothetical protein [Thalassovita aquimarina]MBR9651975.1 hypothetical protein [Thalassovita aquimarina]
MTADRLDPKGLIRESFRIEGIGEPECRSIFLDWALSLPDGSDSQQALPLLIERHASEPDDHPMMAVLREGLGQVGGPKRRGGWRGRRGR